MNTKTAGILGGMGIDVTAELLTRIIDLTGVQKEQDNIPVVIDHNPKIPDRTQAIAYAGESPLPYLKTSIDLLVKTGVDFVAMPCNTAHYYYDEIQEHTPIPIINMIEAVIEKSILIKKDIKYVGLLATIGTVNAGLYQAKFIKKDIKTILPNEKDQITVMNNIMRIKAREDQSSIKRDFVRIGQELITRKAEIVVIGCTDISLAMKDGDLEVPIVCSLQVLAEKVVNLALSSK